METIKTLLNSTTENIEMNYNIYKTMSYILEGCKCFKEDDREKCLEYLKEAKNYLETEIISIEIDKINSKIKAKEEEIDKINSKIEAKEEEIDKIENYVREQIGIISDIYNINDFEIKENNIDMNELQYINILKTLLNKDDIKQTIFNIINEYCTTSKSVTTEDTELL